MRRMKKEILEAVNIIVDTCMISSICKECPLGTNDNKCIFKIAKFPRKIPVKHEEEQKTWRAYNETSYNIENGIINKILDSTCDDPLDGSSLRPSI